MLLARLHRFNQRHPWSHNDHYGRWVSRKISATGARHVLDVGCGTGNLVARLRHHATTVTGLEPDPATSHVAAARFVDDTRVAILQTDFAGRDRWRRWDAITMVAVLHHLPLGSTLRELRGCLAPGGRLVIIGCYRAISTVDILADLPAIIANPIIGLIKHPSRAVAMPEHMTAPTNDPSDTLADIRRAAAQELTGARIRRRLFWRYSLIFDAPGAESLRDSNPLTP